MNKHIASKLMSLLSRRELKERLAKVAMVLSCFAVFCITYILVAPVLTEEWPAVCGMEEHTHDDSCYEERLVQPEPELICGLEETGHVHTDACYEMRRGDLMCTETGTEEEPHVHDDSCYAWNYELVCTESTEGHIHDESCYAEPAEPYMERVLICELPEHTHTDSCYHVPEENPAPDYICGFSVEHTHTEECYFEDGSLKCTVPEHIHTEDCVAKELPELSENEELMPVDEQFTYENEEVTVTFTVQGEIPVAVAETEEIETAEVETETETVETTEPALELAVTESENQEAYNEYEELATEDGDVMLMQVLDYSLTLDGTPVDLGRCEVTTEVTPKPELQQMMDSPMPLMTYAAEAEDMEDESSETETFMELTTYSESNGEVAYAVIAGANPSFTVQYYANLERAVRQDYGKSFGNDYNAYKSLVGQGKLPLINTEGKSLPTNGMGQVGSPNNNDVAYLTVKDGKIETERTLTEIYQAQELKYQNAPGLKYFNIVLKNQNSQYKLTNIWILKPDGDPKSTEVDENNEPVDWISYDYNKDTTRFTNRQETADADPSFIYIGDGAVIRLVYDTQKKPENFPANFYDYNISDGKLYKSNSMTGTFWLGRQLFEKGMGLDSDWNTLYMNTAKQGINSNGNYAGKTGAKLAFGNANAGVGLHTETWGGNALNTANRDSNGGKDSFLFCTFGLAAGADKVTTGEGKTEYWINYANGVNAPNLFNEGTATGKNTYQGTVNKETKTGEKYSLQFERVGDTYTLSAVNGTGAQNLTQFNHPKFGNKTYDHIYTNNFWPMDGAGAGIDSTDSQFGSYKDKGRIKNAKDNMPDSDDGQYHNSYFGMQFAVTFDLTKNYVGPLEYYFFGDDDMWVFLDDTLICDIGGVHSAVGEYVNLWDYINKADLDKLADDEVKTYTLTFYYTERGASGSTCWMQFTLPTVVGLDLESELQKEVDANNGSLWIQKELSGVENTDEFRFKLELAGDGKYDNYVVQGPNGEIFAQGDEVLDYIGNDGTFTLRDGAVLVVQKLPEGTEYTITEINNEGYHTESATWLYNAEKEAQKNGTELQKTVTTGTIATGQITVNDITKVVFTNHATYELPATGGSGTVLWYTIGGILVLTGLCLLVYNNKQKRGKATI